MRLIDLRARIIESLGGELPYDWGWEPEPCEPDDYAEDGQPIYDISSRILELDCDASPLLALLDKVQDGKPMTISWLEDNFVPNLRGIERWSDWAWVDE